MSSAAPPGRRLFVQSEQWFHRAHAALLGALPCRRGCSRCCIGPFAITILDIAELKRGLPALPRQTVRDIESKARAHVATLESAYPRLAATPFLDDWPDSDIDRLAARFADLPCPALDADGSCRIYPFRPLACRSMGIPVEAANLVHGACEVQTAIPLIRPSRAIREEEQQLAGQEAIDIEVLRAASPESGEEMLLAHGFLAACAAIP
jgi:Fe-S-cluster containining protein